jgi:ComF family protein
LIAGLPVAAVAGRLATAVLDLLLPPLCLTCATRVDAPGLQCAGCFATRVMICDPVCVCCGAPFERASDDAEGGACQRCAAAPPSFDRARAALAYGDAARRLVLPFKHADRQDHAGLLARLMAGAGGALLRDADLLVPVPVHRLRLFRRRYNQAALLARELGRISGRPVLLDGLGRSRATDSLGGKTAIDRRAEVADAFTVRPGRLQALRGRRILLIDDVMTSGATARACAETLLEAGAASVDVLVAARVPDPVPKRKRRRRRAVAFKSMPDAA